MREKKSKVIWNERIPNWCFSLVFALSFSTFACAQNEVPVTSVSALTKDQFSIRVFLTKPFIQRGDDIILNYVVRNNSSKEILFLDSTESVEARVVDIGEIKVFSAFEWPDAHFRVTYKFRKLRPGQSLPIKVKVPASVYLDDKEYSFEDATIRIEVAYIVSNKPPDECEDTRYSLPCQTAVEKLVQRLQLGALHLDIFETKSNKLFPK